MDIAEILKYCPKGTKLYSTIHGEVTLRNIFYIDKGYPIVVITCNSAIQKFTEEGHYLKNYPNSECVLFPSKNQRDWNKFRLPVKKGDIMMVNNRAFIISNEYADAFNGAFHKYICGIDTDGTFKVSQSDNYWISEFYIPASEEAKKELFDKMAEAGYKWNAHTLELEKIEPKFKAGDFIKNKQGTIYLISEVFDYDVMYIKAALPRASNLIIDLGTIQSFDDMSMATEEEKNKLLSALVREGYKYNRWQHKLIKQEFKPFDKVLVRGNDTEFWKADIYLGYMKNNSCPYRCTKANYERCIPYEGNEYLLDTANSPT